MDLSRRDALSCAKSLYADPPLWKLIHMRFGNIIKSHLLPAMPQAL